MGFLSFHAGTEGKIKNNEVKKAAGHTFRKTEQLYKSHKNKDIDPSKTYLNIDVTADDKSLDELVSEKLEREYKGKRALRTDAVVVREVIAQPSSDYFVGLTDSEKQQKMTEFMADSLPWFQQEFGESNVLGLSAHMDETNPHVHFAIMPMTEDGRLSQKDFFKGPAGLKRMHREYREHMISAGWDFEMENKNESSKGVKLDDYKKNAEAIEEQRAELTSIKRKMKDDAAIRSEVKAELRVELEPVVVADLNRILDEERAEMEEDKKQWFEKQKERLNATFKDAARKNKEKYEERLKTAEIAATKKGMQKGVRLGLKKVGEMLYDKMNGSNFVREKVLSAFEDGKYAVLANSWDNAKDIRAKEKERQQRLINDVQTTHIDIDHEELEL